MIPAPIKSILRPLYYGVYEVLPSPPKPPEKYDSELGFWKSRWQIDNGNFRNDHFQRIMLAMAGEDDDEFLRGKIVADFGCGPRGSLVWANSAAIRIGIDVLASRYADLFTGSVTSHGMIYVKSTEKTIPIPSGFVDVLFTLNAIDHVNDFGQMCGEILRILKPGGEFIGSFNLEEPATSCEPQSLTEIKVKNHLLNWLEIKSYRAARPGPPDDLYKNLFENNLNYQAGEMGYLWVRARKN